MTDKELLELAAKAAGIYSIDVMLQDPYPHYWDPLNNDGDAFRLMVKLGIKTVPYPVYSEPKHSVLASKLTPAQEENDEYAFVGPMIEERYNGDPDTATRRAIVRAAAELGKGKRS